MINMIMSKKQFEMVRSEIADLFKISEDDSLITLTLNHELPKILKKHLGIVVDLNWEGDEFYDKGAKMKEECCKRVSDKWTLTNIPHDNDTDNAISSSPCCDAPLIYYNVDEDYFCDDNKKLLITKEGIDNIKALYRIISSDEFIYQRDKEKE